MISKRIFGERVILIDKKSYFGCVLQYLTIQISQCVQSVSTVLFSEEETEFF